MRKARLRAVPERMLPKRLGIFTTVWTVAVLYAATVIQSAVISYLTNGGPQVDILITAAVMLSIYTNEYYGAVIGVTVGAMFDMLNFSRIPIMPIILLIACAYCGAAFRDMKKGYLLMKLVAVASVNAIRFGLSLVLELWRNSTFTERLLSSALPGYGISMLLAPIIIMACCPAARDSLFGHKKI